MNVEICKNCGKLECYVLDDSLSCDKKPYLVLQFRCNNRMTSNKIVDKFVLENHKWKRKKVKNGSFFSKVSIKQIEDELKTMKVDKSCPYYIEHLIVDWN